jgi:hypothetical protein
MIHANDIVGIGSTQYGAAVPLIVDAVHVGSWLCACADGECEDCRRGKATLLWYGAVALRHGSTIVAVGALIAASAVLVRASECWADADGVALEVQAPGARPIVAAGDQASNSPDEDIVSRPIVLPRGVVEVTANVEAWLLPGRAFDAISVAPDIFVGVTQRLTLGVTSSNRALSSVSAGGGACFGPVTSGCVAKIADVGVDAIWQARAGALAWAPHARLVMRQFSPSKPAAMLGARVRWHHGRWAVVADPYLQLGLANTDRGNRHALHVPLWLQVQPTCRWSIGLRTGFESEFAVIRDGWHGVLGGVVTAAVTPSITIELSGGVRSAFGPQNTSKERSLALAVSVRR